MCIDARLEFDVGALVWLRVRVPAITQVPLRALLVAALTCSLFADASPCVCDVSHTGVPGCCSSLYLTT